MYPLESVTSLVEVWIEMEVRIRPRRIPRSLPLWKCGLKSDPLFVDPEPDVVTSLVEVWIEIEVVVHHIAPRFVTSLVEVWIEIQEVMHRRWFVIVTSLVEVWIEIGSTRK